MFILFTNLFLARSFRLENTLECYNLRGGQRGFTEVASQTFLVLYIFTGFPENLENQKKLQVTRYQIWQWRDFLHFRSVEDELDMIQAL